MDEKFLAKLAKFLVLAKKNTYASGSAEIKKRDGSRMFLFKNDGFYYEDRYFLAPDKRLFFGQEIVRTNLIKDSRIPAWFMNYCGRIQKDANHGPEDIYRYLRAMLSKVKKEYPFRGPSYSDHEDSKGIFHNFSYYIRLEGDIREFEGIEIIRWHSRNFKCGCCIEYQGNFNGGIL